MSATDMTVKSTAGTHDVAAAPRSHPGRWIAAAALVVADKAADLPDGVRRAQHALDSGEAKGVLDRLVAASNG